MTQYYLDIDPVTGLPKRFEMPYDDYSGSEYLTEQTSAGTVLTFTFSAAVHQVWVEMASGDSTAVARVRADGVDPTSSVGIPARDKVPVPMTVTTSEVRVLAPTDAVVNVWGYRR